MKISLCMWTKNSEKYLDQVLESIEKAIPSEYIKEKIIIDDQSIDNTTTIAKEHNWKVTPNIQGGICGGFNRALELVDTEYFASFEHDILLNPKWLDYMIEHTKKENFIVCQGLRVPSHKIIRALYEKRLQKGQSAGASLDNNLWHTQKAKSLLRFPADQKYLADRYLRKKVEQQGYEWIIDRRVKSIHIRESVIASKKHYNKMMMTIQNPQPTDRTRSFLKYGLNGMQNAANVMFRQNMPEIAVYYPYMAICTIRTHIKRKAKLTNNSAH